MPATANRTYTLHGHTTSGIIQWYDYTPHGTRVTVATRVVACGYVNLPRTDGTLIVSETEKTVEEARAHYRELVRRGYARVN